MKEILVLVAFILIIFPLLSGKVSTPKIQTPINNPLSINKSHACDNNERKCVFECPEQNAGAVKYSVGIASRAEAFIELSHK